MVRRAMAAKVGRVAWVVSSIRDSLLGWLGAGSGDAAPALEPARHAMLDLLLFEGTGMEEAAHLLLLRRVRYARDLDTLWYLRPELVRALAARHGERVARTRVNELSAYFGIRAIAHGAARSNSLFGR